MGNGGASFFGVGQQESWAERHRVPEVPPPLIPIVFVPGIMGSNLRLRESAIPEAWKAFEEEYLARRTPFLLHGHRDDSSEELVRMAALVEPTSQSWSSCPALL